MSLVNREGKKEHEEKTSIKGGWGFYHAWLLLTIYPPILHSGLDLPFFDEGGVIENEKRGGKMVALNLFLTGEPGVGKTSLIKKIFLKWPLTPGGFMVEREGTLGDWRTFYLENAEDVLAGKNLPPAPQTSFAHREDGHKKWQLKPQVFNHQGVFLLKKDQKNRDIILMDELGRFEGKAFLFQKTVLDILGSPKPVLGVIKKEKNPFLDSIRNRRDVKIFLVDKSNREEIFFQLEAELQQLFPEKQPASSR